VGGVVVLLGLLYFGLGGDSGPATTGTSAKVRKKTTSAKADGLYTKEDEDARFPPLSLAVVDSFNPLVKKAKPAAITTPVAPTGGPTGIDASLTGGEGTWYYTGWVELDGRRQALLENPTTGETDYVTSGESWKRTRVTTVDVSTVVLVGPDGKSHRVPILDYGEFPGKTPAAGGKAGGQPLNVPSGAIAGAIGNAPNPTLNVRPVAGTATMTLPNGTTVQVPLDASAATTAADANNGRNGRRNRRNRNNGSNGNFGNPGNLNNVP